MTVRAGQLFRLMVLALNGTVVAMADARNLNEVDDYSDRSFTALVEKYVSSSGQVDYSKWHRSAADRRTLDNHIAQLGQMSPENRPELFNDQDAIRRYWINAYNALVLHHVLALWPLESVRDVRVSLTSRVIRGKGFFYDKKIVIGGRETNLYKLENEVLRQQLKDPRIHFALNCATESCPVLKPSNWSDDELDNATREFINNPRNVAVTGKRVFLSTIFKWYKEDFPSDRLGYLQQYAAPELFSQLEIAKQQRYPIRYFKYDWGINDDAEN